MTDPLNLNFDGINITTKKENPKIDSRLQDLQDLIEPIEEHKSNFFNTNTVPFAKIDDASSIAKPIEYPESTESEKIIKRSSPKKREEDYPDVSDIEADFKALVNIKKVKPTSLEDLLNSDKSSSDKISKKSTVLSTHKYKSQIKHASPKRHEREHKPKSIDHDIISENNNDRVRREKSELIERYKKINVNNRYSMTYYDMNCSLYDIKNAVTNLVAEHTAKQQVQSWEQILYLSVLGVETLNTKFDPLGVDIDGWSEQLQLSIQCGDYEEVLLELYEKYKAQAYLSPEARLAFQIFKSGLLFSMSKKVFGNGAMGETMLNTFMNKMAPKPTQQAPVQQVPVQQFPVQQVPLPPRFQPNYQPMAQAPPQFPFQQNVPQFQPQEPIKQNHLQGPSMDVTEILQKMEQRKQEQQNAQLPEKKNLDELLDDLTSTEDEEKQIELGDKKRGRPKKTTTTAKKTRTKASNRT